MAPARIMPRARLRIADEAVEVDRVEGRLARQLEPEHHHARHLYARSCQNRRAGGRLRAEKG
eukprot:5801359-Pleurochrysis_carterae.AAC.1